MLYALLLLFPLLADAAAPSTSPPAPAPSEIIVGSGRGLEAWRLDGTGKRIISKEKALFPRWLNDTTVLALVPSEDGNLAKGARLDRIAIADGARAKVAKLPSFGCKRRPDAEADSADPGEGLQIQDPDDFMVDQKKQRACIELMDRNINMANLAVDVVVDLKSGIVSRWLSLGEDICVPPAGVKKAKLKKDRECDFSPRLVEATEARPYRFTDDGTLVKTSDPQAPVLVIKGYAPDTSDASPSGRWLVLSGDQEDADYIHRSVVLLDQETGQVFPLGLKRSWPSPLKPSGKSQPPRLKTPIAKTASVVGETDIRWIGTSSETEYLIIDDLVIKPGVRSFSVKGQIVR